MKIVSERKGILAAACLLSVLVGGIASAGPDPCLTVDGEIIACTGDQSGGIASSPNPVPPGDFRTPPAHTLKVQGLSGPIQPATPGTEGISFINYSGSGVAVESGSGQDTINIVTNGADAIGILVGSQGTPASFSYRNAITIYVPNAGATGGGAGGPVVVENYGNMATDGTGSHGIVAANQTGGFPTYVTQSLENFNPGNVTFSLVSVAGLPSYIDCTVSGSGGGTFVLHPDGTFDFDMGSSFDNLAVGGKVFTGVNYQVRQTSTGGSDLADGVLQVGVTRADNGALVWAATNHFDEYVGYDNYSAVLQETPLWPDLQSYVDGLKGDAGLTTDNAAGLLLKNYGNIGTKGASSSGIVARTYGGAGASGRNGGGFWSFGTKEPTAGKPGASGGGIDIHHDGSIHTSGADSPGTFAYSLGGTGGRGGDGGFYYSGRQGGKGGTGGNINIRGSGTLATEGNKSSGILAVSEGGIGGAGGGDSTWVNGGGGGYGGSAGSVVVDGAFRITTQGTESHGIWAKSIGGSGGVGGTGGIFGSGGSGGGASNGGTVTIRNAGVDNTLGNYSYGIYGMSVGGFGGDGGSASGIFVSYGGSGASAGDGGKVSITNTETGVVSTAGEGSHAVFAQSIGGGGGSGGSASAIVGLGGASAAGGHGGAVSVANEGWVGTSGTGARGIYAQSIGGGGGDGGSSGGLVGIGGDGGAASNGGTISIVSSGSITTTGNYAEAIYAQSIGGGGGSGGASGGLVSIGGSGAGGGNADNVTVENAGMLETSGIRSRAIFAQSIGGGGGDGAGSGGLVSLGGDGSGAGSGAKVEVTNTGSITTTNILSNAIQAQSVGGGGGSGAGSGGGVSLGGSGGGGGDGGQVIVHNLGEIVTLDNDSRGVSAQSIGGGGGDGAGSGGLVSLGGSGDGGGNGGTVTVVNDNRVVTSGARSDALFAQSIGGGGGSGGGSGGIVSLGGSGDGGGNGGSVTLENAGFIHTAGIYSRGIFAQSIGGGGGDGAGSGATTVSLGGSGDGGGNGDNVTVRNRGVIATDNFASQAIFAQSVGGGGGSGAGSGAFTVSLGGDGGSGGDGGAVRVTNDNQLLTSGRYSAAIFAQSVGGGGGSGAGSGAWFASLGGKGSRGGSGGDVTVINSGLIATDNDWSHGIFAQSVGGGGGSGAGSGGVWVAIGGEGGAGSHGGDVGVTNDGAIRTSGSGARGIHAESIGGGGGNGGGSGALNISIGGDGGSAGNGGDVTVTNTGPIATLGRDAHSVYASSVGGGGGSASLSGAAIFTLGGDGASGGDGGAINVTTRNRLETSGVTSSGIFAQSVGGGGGNGGGALNVAVGANFSVGVALGGEGGLGGNGNSVTIDSAGGIETIGENSHGIVAQSLGGGGGSGGNSFVFSASAAVIPEIPLGVNVAVALGGEGGNGGDGGIVEIGSRGNIATSGFRSSGILAQSVGGGGGDGGNATSIALSINCDASGNVAIGGGGGEGGDGKVVRVDSSGILSTEGAHSTGILAQSIGGGGGAGGDSTTVSVDLSFPTGPEDFIPKPSGSFTLSMGGDGGAGGGGDNVTVRNDNRITTKGVFATGVLAQSIGGGGGAGGNARSFQIDLSANPVDYVPFLDILDFSTRLVFGGDGGDGGSGKVVRVTSSNDILTEGAFAHGIAAQSVGGGGGAAGTAFTFEFSTTDLPPDIPGLDEITGLTKLDMVMEGADGAAGNGGTVTVGNSGNMATRGDFAHGIVAQSVGGGGGIAGMLNPQGVTRATFGPGMRGVLKQIEGVGVGFAGSVGGNGSGGEVKVEQNGTITTQGRYSHGVFAQSAGGVLSGGPVSVTLNGNIEAPGVDSSGILAQSVGGTGGGNIAVNILPDSTVTGGSGEGAGIQFLDGANNDLTNRGTIATALPGGAGMAIGGTSGHDRIHNYGTVTGSVDLGAGANLFHNYPTGTFNSGAEVYLGNGNLLTNDGTLSPGGTDNVQTTILTGDLVQTQTGNYLADLDLKGGRADRLNLWGNADLSGRVVLHLMDPGYIPPGTQRFHLVMGGSSIDNSGLTMVYQPSAIVHYELSFTGTDLDVLTRTTFSPAGLTENQAAIGNAINSIQLAGGTEAFSPVAAELVSMESTGEVAHAYDQMSPVNYASYTKAAHDVSRLYTQNLLKRIHSVRAGLQTADSRAEPGDRAQWLLAYSGSDESIRTLTIPGDDARRKTARYGAWVDAFFQDGKQDGKEGFTGYDFQSAGGTIGLDYLFGERFLAGVSVGMSGTGVDLYSQQGDGDIKGVFASLYGSYFTRHLYLDMALSYGGQSFDGRRNYAVGSIHGTASSDHNGDLFSGYVEGGYNFEKKNWILQPYAGLQYIYLSEEAFTESGPGPLNLGVSSQETGSLVSELGLRLNCVIPVANGNFLPEVSAAWNYDFGIDDRLVTASFAGAPGTSFSVKGQESETNGLIVGAGITYMGKGGLSSSLKYRGDIRGDFQSHSIIGELLRYEF